MESPTKQQLIRFSEKIKTFYRTHGRDLPWRHTNNPYHILVSEIMLQQTQVERVIDKYTLFIQTFPTIQSLAQAPLELLLKTWQGLGYNRRALLLQKCARKIVHERCGVLPDSPDQLILLPGIGKATAASICAFAFDKPVIFIETNIRAVFIHEFFPEQSNVSDEQLLPLIEKTLDKKQPLRWYSALMDYGTHLKKTYPNPSRKSAHHARQSPFEGSDRQIRGNILRLLLEHKHCSFKKIMSHVKTENIRLQVILRGMADEGFISCVDKRYTISQKH